MCTFRQIVAIQTQFVQYLCVAVVPVQHRGVAPEQPAYEAHQPGCLAAGQGVPHLLRQHWNTSPPKAH